MAQQTKRRAYFTEPVLGGIINSRGKYVAPQKGYMCGKYKRNPNKKEKSCTQMYPCYFEGCSKPSTYGYIEDMKRISCLEHKKENMRSLKGHFCHCKKRASYNYEGMGAKFCKKHSQEGMIIVNVRRCSHEGCTTIPTYYYPDKNNPNKKLCVRCFEHKLEGMISKKKSTPS
jgi:hypothetical protein